MPQKDFDLILKVQADLKEANRQLQSLNDNMRVSNKSAREASGGMDALTRSTDKSEKGIRGIRTQLDGMGGTIKSAASNLKVLAGVIGVAFAVHKIADWTRGLVDANEQLFQMAKMAESLNVSVKFFSGLTQQADDYGVGVQQVGVAVATLNRQLATAKRGSTTAEGLFKAFGIDPATVRNSDDAILSLADNVKKYGLNAERSGQLSQLMGSNFKQLVPILKQGAAGIRAQNDAMEKTGQIITDSQVPAIVQLHDATDRIGDSFTALRNNLIVQLAPSISQIADQFNDFVTTQGPALVKQITDLAAKLPEIARDFGDIAGEAFKAANAIAGFIHYAANVNSGAKAGDIAGLSVEQSDIQAELKQRAAHPVLSGLNTFLAGTENNALQNTLEAGRPRIQSMSTAELQKRLATIEAQLLQARVAAAKPTNQPNPQEGDTRGLFVGEGSGGASGAPPTAPNPAAASRALAIAQQAAAAQQALTAALIAQKAQVDPVTAAWETYSIAEGNANAEAAALIKQNPKQAAAINATRDAQIELARIARDSKLDEIAKKDEAAWQSLRDGLRTPLEVHVDQAMAKIRQLTASVRALADSKDAISNTDFGKALSGIIDQSMAPMPMAQSTSGLPGGVDTSQSLLGQSMRDMAGQDDWFAKAQQTLETEREAALQSAQGYREKELAIQQVFDAKQAQLANAHAAETARIKHAQYFGELQMASTAFGQLAQVAAQRYGTESRQYQILFALSKSFAIAQAAVSLATNVSKASEIGFPYNIPFIVGAFAQGAEIVSIISGANFSGGGGGGYATGGLIRGPGTPTSDSIPARLSNGEYVVRAAAVKQYGVDFLHQLNAQGFAAGGLVSPFANAPSPAQMGFTSPRPLSARLPDPSTNAAGAARQPQDIKVVVLLDKNALANEVMNSPTGQKVIVKTVSDHPRTIQGGWRSG